MAGWCVIWNDAGAQLDVARWNETLRCAGRCGERVHSRRIGECVVAAWSRTTGEFPHSGRILEFGCADQKTNGVGNAGALEAAGAEANAGPHTNVAGPAALVAWLGQCRGPDGDVSRAAAAGLAIGALTDADVAALNGPFAAAVIAADGAGLALWTDRHRHYPVYVYGSGRRLIAATDLVCLRPWLASPALDRNALDLLLRTGECIDRATLLTGVEVLPPATCAVFHAGRYVERQYWQLRFEPDHRLTLPEAASEVGRRLRAAVGWCEEHVGRLAVPLSGGLDSRLLLGLCQHPQAVPSFTWGTPRCRDIECAREFARAAGSPHQVYHWDPPAFVPLWPAGVERTGGATGIVEMFMAPFVGLLAQHADAILDGLAGDALLGGNFLKWSWLHERELGALAEASWRWRVAPETDAWVDRLLPDVQSGASRQTWCASICRRGPGAPVERLNEWLIDNRVFRNANCGTMLVRGGLESYAPFFDRDVIDFLLRVPLACKFKHRLYLKTLRTACPLAARTRWQRTGLPPGWGLGANVGAMVFQRVATAALRPLGLRPFARARVADPATWFRGPWRAPAADLLFSARARERQLCDQRVVRALWDAHQAGANHTSQLGVLIAVELFARCMLDGVTDSPPGLSARGKGRDRDSICVGESAE